jgi:hypothetical protein
VRSLVVPGSSTAFAVHRLDDIRDRKLNQPFYTRSGLRNQL